MEKVKIFIGKKLGKDTIDGILPADGMELEYIEESNRRSFHRLIKNRYRNARFYIRKFFSSARREPILGGGGMDWDSVYGIAKNILIYLDLPKSAIQAAFFGAFGVGLKKVWPKFIQVGRHGVRRIFRVREFIQLKYSGSSPFAIIIKVLIPTDLSEEELVNAIKDAGEIFIAYDNPIQYIFNCDEIIFTYKRGNSKWHWYIKYRGSKNNRGHAFSIF